MEACTGLGLGSTLFPGVLWAQAQGKGAVKITKEMIDAAAAVADVAISEEYKQMMLDNLNEQAKGYEAIYGLHIPNSVEPALLFDPIVNAAKYETERRAARLSAAPNISTPQEGGGVGVCQRAGTGGVGAHEESFIERAYGNVFGEAQAIRPAAEIHGDAD